MERKPRHPDALLVRRKAKEFKGNSVDGQDYASSSLRSDLTLPFSVFLLNMFGTRKS